MHRRIEPGDIGRPLRGLLYKARSPEDMKSSDSRLGQWLGGDWKLAYNSAKQQRQGGRETILLVALLFVRLQETCRRNVAINRQIIVWYPVGKPGQELGGDWELAHNVVK